MTYYNHQRNTFYCSHVSIRFMLNNIGILEMPPPLFFCLYVCQSVLMKKNVSTFYVPPILCSILAQLHGSYVHAAITHERYVQRVQYHAYMETSTCLYTCMNQILAKTDIFFYHICMLRVATDLKDIDLLFGGDAAM